MSRVVVDVDQLELAARRLGQAGADLDETARRVDGLAERLPPPLSGLYREASWAARRGLEAQAEALERLAAELRLVRRAVQLASAGGFDPALAATAAAFATQRRRGGPPRPPFLPPPAPRGGREPADEELLRWLRQQAGWHLLAGPGGLARLQLSAAGGVGERSGSGAVGAGAAVVVVLGLLLAARAVSDSSSTVAQPTPVPTGRTPDPRCDAGPPGDEVDAAKKRLLNPREIDAVRRELKGEVVATKRDGTAYDHVQEYTQEQSRVRKQIAKLQWIIGADGCSPGDKTAAERELKEASKLLDWSEKNVVPRK